ncbi:hypothetical protein ABT097_06680 [Streptomyces sp. NPDC002225]|uniref:hypothetical protein n=1 Tax=Streptomyces sp. NPDC002225 TaxID=3154413 RepID=UPI0033205FF9
MTALRLIAVVLATWAAMLVLLLAPAPCRRAGSTPSTPRRAWACGCWPRSPPPR